MTKSSNVTMYKEVLIPREFLENKQRPWKCRFCSRTFKYQYCLQDHAKRLHTIEFDKILLSKYLQNCKPQKRQSRPSVIVPLAEVKKRMRE